MGTHWRFAAILAASGLSLMACGKPEDDSTATATAKSTAPLQNVPAWAAPMMGKRVSEVLNGRTQCEGVFDVVLSRHTGAHPGVELAGWAWDAAAKQPVSRVLFADSNDRIVGAADGGQPRADVAQARHEVTTQNAGWRGVATVTKGTVSAIVVTSHNAACSIGSKDVSDDAQ